MTLVSRELEARAIAWRRHLHANPELSFEEVETSQFVHETLAGFGGLDLERPTPTSVVAHLRGARPGKRLALRADIDALPIQEESGLDFASRRPGVMHACGHDAHTAMLLATAKLLRERRTELEGEVRFVFQHAEEKPPGGASELVAAGVMDGVDLIVGCHITSRLEAGAVLIAVGPWMAAADMFEIGLTGVGGHAGQPHLSVDPIVAAAAVVTGLQQIVSRETSPLDSAVVSVTRISGGTANNVIPERVVLGGTVRALTPETRTRTREAMERVLRGVSEAYRVEHRFDWIEGYAPVVNDSEVAAVVERAARAELGDGAIASPQSVMAGEDFSAYLQVAPGAFFNVGARNEAIGATWPHHHPRFAIDEAALRNGIAVMARTALDILGVEGTRFPPRAPS
jgi:amidohydrolase